MRMVHFFLPLMQTGMKRLCFVSSEAGVVSVARRTQVSSYCMSKTALNMALRLMFNQLQPMGYTFRMYCKDPCASAEKAGEFAAEYFIRNRSNEPESYQHSDENRLVLRDWLGRELPW